MTARRYLEPFQWEIRSAEPDEIPQIELTGCLDETARLDELDSEITGPVCFVTANLQRVNSMGLGKMFRFMQRIADRGPHRMAQCSPSFVRALNMLPVMARFCRVDSVMTAFICPECEHEGSFEVATPNADIELPQPTCPECRASMELDESPGSYFRFARFRK